MKKLRNLILAAAISLSGLTAMNMSLVDAYAEETNPYPMSQQCTAFEVSKVNDNGGFDYVSCHNTLDDAKKAMKDAGSDAVVRHSASPTQTKIIAMTSGVAYTCNWRTGGIVSYTYSGQAYANSNISGYMSSYRQVNYLDTETYNTSTGYGSVLCNVGGYTCYIDSQFLELIPYKYVDRQIAIHLADDIYVKPNIASYTVKQNGSYRDLVYTAYGIFTKDGSKANSVINAAVGPAADWMETGRTYYSWDDVNYYYDRDLTQKAGVYYNYYQFMPLRTASSIPASAYNGFLQSIGYGTNSALYNMGETFLEAEKNYGVNAMMVFAQACLESAYGTSSYAKNRNNLFGLGAVDSNPDNAYSFSSIYECVKDQMGYYLRNYFYADSNLFYGAHYGNKSSGVTVKYASDPYYGLKVSQIAYAFDKYASGSNGGLTEYNSHKTAVITTYAAPVYINPHGDTTYTTEYQGTYQNNNTVAIIGETGEWYKIQSDNYLKDNGYCVNLFEDGSIRIYDWDHNIGYIKKSDVAILSNGNGTSTAPTTPAEPTTPETPVEQTQIGTVTVNVEKLNIRIEPKTGSSSIGYAVNGKTYPVYDIKSQGGYTWYQIGSSQWIADNGSWVTYKAGTEEENTTVIEGTSSHVMSFVENMSVDNGVLTISGEAFIKGCDVYTEDDIRHQIEIVNLETDEITTVDAVTSSLSESEFLGDGHTYIPVLYSAAISLNDLPEGNYALKTRVTTKTMTASKAIYSDSKTVNFSDLYDSSTGLTTSVYVNNQFKNRLEIRKEHEGIDRSLINKPTVKYSTRGLDNIVMNGSTLSFEGYGYMYQASMTQSVNPSYKMILVNEAGNATEVGLTAKASLLDYAKLIKVDYSLDYADFDGTVDMSSLPAGTYRVYLDMSTTEYRDIDEIINFTDSKEYSSKDGNRTYTLKTSNVHGRFILEVTE